MIKLVQAFEKCPHNAEGYLLLDKREDRYEKTVATPVVKFATKKRFFFCFCSIVIACLHGVYQPTLHLNICLLELAVSRIFNFTW